MRPAPPARIAFAATTLEAAGPAIDLGLRPGDERRQAVDAATVRNGRLGLRLRLILRLRTMFTLTLARLAMFTRLLLVALIGLVVAIAVAMVVVAHIGLRLRRDETRLLA